MKYDLKDLITFVNVAKLKSFTKASQTLSISKAVVTTRINDLEKSVGMMLLARTTREVNLTSEGTNFLNYCHEILRRVETLDDFIDGCKGINGSLRIALPPYFSRNHIVPYLDEFLKKHPKLKLNLTLTENPINIIEEGYDLQIRIQLLEEENLEVAKLMANRKLICASPEYIARHGQPKTIDALLEHNCIIFGENEIWKFKHKSTGTIEKLRTMDGNIRCNNGEIIKDITLSGIGITLKSLCDIEEEISNGTLIPILTDYEVINETEFYAVYPSSRSISPKIRAFLEFFQDKLLNKKLYLPGEK